MPSVPAFSIEMSYCDSQGGRRSAATSHPWHYPVDLLVAQSLDHVLGLRVSAPDRSAEKLFRRRR